MAKLDGNVGLRRLPLVAGGLSGVLFFANRVLTVEVTDGQVRSDILGVILSALLILTGLLWQQVQPKAPESVQLIGEEGFELAPDLPERSKIELAWASVMLLRNTATRSLVVWYDGRVLLRRGVLGLEREVKPGAIVQRAIGQQKPVYLVALKLYPGRVEFDYLPSNTQGVICQPLGDRGVLILGANAPRSYTKQDEGWIEGIAEKIAENLSHYLGSD